MIVTAVIAVLSAVVIVSYRGVSQTATRDSIASELQSRASLAARSLVENSVGTKTCSSVGITQPDGSTMSCRIIDDTFCVSIVKSAQTFHITEQNEVKTGACPALPAVPGIPRAAPQLVIKTGYNASATSWTYGTRAFGDPFVGLFAGWQKPSSGGVPSSYKVTVSACGSQITDDFPLSKAVASISQSAYTNVAPQIVEYTGGYVEIYNPRIKWSVEPFTSARCGAFSNFFKTDVVGVQACNISGCGAQLKFRMADPLSES